VKATLLDSSIFVIEAQFASNLPRFILNDWMLEVEASSE
jgi:hypothetical protein